MSPDIDSTAIVEWMVTSGPGNDKENCFGLLDSVRNHGYVLKDAAYDSSDVYDYLFENCHSWPVIDTNPRRGIVAENLTVNRKMGIELRLVEKQGYRLRWEIERTFSILEEILGCEHIWYVRNRDYDVALGIKAIAYNLVIMINQISHREKRKIMDIVV